ncbi:MAG: helix-turn-helix transcriptional regulator [Deltaproteobacteria bacterium]|nr:helix-turn-helix transcriptional regulator [Deltaproteobacteria bacterium]
MSSPMTLLAARADVIGVLEALYEPAPDLERWSRRALGAFTSLLADPLTPSLGVVAHGDDFAGPTPLAAVVGGGAVDDLSPGFAAQLRCLGREGMRAVYYPGPTVTTYRASEAHITGEGLAILRAYRAAVGAPDGSVLFAYPRPGLVVVVSSWASEVVHLARGERRVLERVAGHLDTAARLQVAPEAAVAAVLSPAGRFVHVADAAVAARRERLAAHVAQVERARLERHRREPAAIDHWQALIVGRYSVVPREDTDGKRYYLLVHNAPRAEPHARFTAREIDVVRLAARGVTGKGISYALGLSPSAVSTALQRAAAKVGLRSRTALLAVVGPMFGAAGAAGAAGGDVDRAALTPAERDVLSLLRRGMSNEEIASARARSRRTVANQVASLLQKTGAPSRRALAAVGP